MAPGEQGVIVGREQPMSEHEGVRPVDLLDPVQWAALTRYLRERARGRLGGRAR